MPVNNVDFIKKYKNGCSTFIETGTFQGDTVQLALDAGFETIRSVELNANNYKKCRVRFRDQKDKVRLYHGHSEHMFWDMIKEFNDPLMFWLDSHYSGCGDTYETSLGNTYSSLKFELKTLAKHPVKNHIIMIDDVRDFNTINMDFITREVVVKMVLDINPNYLIVYDTGDNTSELFKNDVLIAIPPID